MLIENGKVFLEDHFEAVSVRLQDGRIEAVGALSALPGEQMVDAAGRYVLPGFVDIHIHAFAGADCMRGAHDVRKMSRRLLRSGVAAFLPTTMSASVEETNAALLGIQAVMDDPEPEGAAVLGAHMEAPFLAAGYKGAQEEEFLRAPDWDVYQEMTAGVSCVRMMTLAPELPGALPLIERLRREGVMTCAAHSGASAEQVHAAADAGLTQITHLFNAQTPLYHRAPGVPGAGLADDRLLVQVIADGIHLHPDVLRIAALCKGAKGVALITDAMEAAGLPEGEYALGGQKVLVSHGAARLESGVLAGSTLLMHEAVRNMITLAGMPPEEVVPMATSTPAASIGAEGFGVIRPGAAGVLALMDEDWRFAGVVCERLG